MWPFSALGGPKVKTCSVSKGIGTLPTHSHWNLPNEIKTVSLWLMSMCYLIIWCIKFDLKRPIMLHLLLHLIFLTSLRFHVLWSCAMSDCIFEQIFIAFYTRGSSSISPFTVARAGTWYLIAFSFIDYGRIVPVVATGGFSDPPGSIYRSILSSCSCYRRILCSKWQN